MVRKYTEKKLSGFSLFELLITMGVLMLITLIVFPLAIQKTQASKLESYASQIVTDIYFQQQRSSFKKFDGGVYLETNSYVLFDGPSFEQATEIDTKRYPSNVSISSISPTLGQEILFLDGQFKSTTYGFFVISDGVHRIRVHINQEGLIDYEKI